MAEIDPPKKTGFTRVAARASCLCFFFAIITVVGLATVKLRPEADESDAFLGCIGGAAFLLFPIGFLLGVTAVPGAIKARGRDLLLALAGVGANGLILWLILYNVWFANPHGFSPRLACICNLKQIDGAKATWALENHKSTNGIPADTDLFGKNAYILVKPQCPKGGKYVIGNVEATPTCSVPGHTL